MKIDSLIYGGVPIIKIDGKIIGDGSQILRSKIEDQMNKGTNQIILDLGEVDLMDSSALGSMVAALISLQKKRGKLLIINPQKTVKDILEITRLNMVFEIHSSLEKALESLKSAKLNKL